MTVDISRFFTNMDRPVYALKNLPEEVVAYLFARYSRSTLSLRDDLRQMIEAEDLGALLGPDSSADDGDTFGPLQERARAFAEKYVLGYGHGSVAEHGCVHLALEDVSIIASKLVEDGRLASYTEKSTRYVAFSPEKLYYPPEIMARPALAASYSETVRALLDAYSGWTADFIAQIKARAPRTEKQTERGYEAASRATAFDLLRYLLPASTHTNIGLTLNARALETLITKLLSQPLTEGRELGARLKTEAQQIVPTLLKYANHNAYRQETSDAISALAREILSPGSPLSALIGHLSPVGTGERLVAKATAAAHNLLENQEAHGSIYKPFSHSDGGKVPKADRGLPAPEPARASSVTLISSDPDADDKLVAAILYPHQSLAMRELRECIGRMDAAAKERVVDEYLKRRGRHDAPGRALEQIVCTVEMTMDFGAYRDIQRHRMASQSLQPLSPGLGFSAPREMERFGYTERYEELMARAAETYAQIADAGLVREAAYVLPLATNVRVLFTWNLREVAHFVELRSTRQGHPSYRRVAQDVYRVIAQAHPAIAKYLRPNMNDYALTRD